MNTPTICHETLCNERRVGKSKYCAKHRAEAKARWRSMIAEQSQERRARASTFSNIIAEAQRLGHEAGLAAAPNPMTVTDGVQEWHVPDGVCGFAWVIIRPGNSAFANFLKKQKIAQPDSYYGGVNIWISDHGQSLERKTAHARAMAAFLTEKGFRATAMSRID